MSIRSDIYLMSLDYFGKFYAALYEGGKECPTQCLADEIIDYLKSQGVVQKAEGELPETMMIEGYGYFTGKLASAIASKAGYTLTKDLE